MAAPLGCQRDIRRPSDVFVRSKLSMARSSVTSVLIFFSGLLALVAGMPQARPRAPQTGRPRTGGPGPQAGAGPGPGGSGSHWETGGDGSRVYQCPVCGDPFGSEYGVRQHRSRRVVVGLEDSQTGRSKCAIVKRGPIAVVSSWEAAGQKAGGRVHNSSGAVSKALQGHFATSDSDSDPDPQGRASPPASEAPEAAPGLPPASDSEVSEPPSRMRSPQSNYEPSPSPAAPASQSQALQALPPSQADQVRVSPSLPGPRTAPIRTDSTARGPPGPTRVRPLSPTRLPRASVHPPVHPPRPTAPDSSARLASSRGLQAVGPGTWPPGSRAAPQRPCVCP